jgi:hypothetical protein
MQERRLEHERRVGAGVRVLEGSTQTDKQAPAERCECAARRYVRYGFGYALGECNACTQCVRSGRSDADECAGIRPIVFRVTESAERTGGGERVVDVSASCWLVLDHSNVLSYACESMFCARTHAA